MQPAPTTNPTLYVEDVRVCSSCSQVFDGSVQDYSPAADICEQCTVQPAKPGHWYMDYCLGYAEAQPQFDDTPSYDTRDQDGRPAEGLDFVVLLNTHGGFFVAWLEGGPYMRALAEAAWEAHTYRSNV